MTRSSREQDLTSFVAHHGGGLDVFEGSRHRYIKYSHEDSLTQIGAVPLIQLLSKILNSKIEKSHGFVGWKIEQFPYMHLILRVIFIVFNWLETIICLFQSQLFRLNKRLLPSLRLSILKICIQTLLYIDG